MKLIWPLPPTKLELSAPDDMPVEQAAIVSASAAAPTSAAALRRERRRRARVGLM